MSCLAFHPSERNVAAGDVTWRVMIWKGFGDRTFAGDNGRLKKEDEKPGVIGDGDVDSCTTRHWHFVEVKFLFFSPDRGNPFYLFMHVAGKGGVLEVWQLDTDKRFLLRIRTRLLRFVSQILPSLSYSACLYSSDDHWHLVWEELIYIGLRLFAVNVRGKLYVQIIKELKLHKNVCVRAMRVSCHTHTVSEVLPKKSVVGPFARSDTCTLMLENEAPADFYVLVTGAVELVVTRNEVEHANVGDGTVIMNNLLQELMETENILARCRLDLPLSLCFATLKGDDLLLHKLLKRGLDANESDNNGRTALHIAASKGNTNCVLLLLDFVADPNSRERCCYGDDDDWPPMVVCVIDVWCSGGSIRRYSGGLDGCVAVVMTVVGGYDRCRERVFVFILGQMAFLGHIVSADGITMDPGKVEAITKWPRSKTVAEIRSFLGLVGHYMRFVEGFSRLALPLTKIMRKGCVLMQHGKVIAYASRQLKPYEDYETNIQYHLRKPNLVADALSRKLGLLANLQIEPKIIRDLKSQKEDVELWAVLQKSNEDEQTKFQVDNDGVMWFGDRVKIEHQRASGLLQPLDIPVLKWDEFSMDFTLEDMLRSCALEWTRNWDEYLCLVEFAYNKSWHGSIKAASYELLYGRKCRAPICWNEVGEHVIDGPKLIEVTNEKVTVAKEKLKEARSRQKNYVDRHRRELAFNPEDRVFLKVSPCRGVRRFGIKEKLSPWFIGPFKILDRVGEGAYGCILGERKPRKGQNRIKTGQKREA
nr:putative nucleotidyltransferase, ribonuclease H [Tanacetum cinerariifolium]